MENIGSVITILVNFSLNKENIGATLWGHNLDYMLHCCCKPRQSIAKSQTVFKDVEEELQIRSFRGAYRTPVTAIIVQ